MTPLYIQWNTLNEFGLAEQSWYLSVRWGKTKYSKAKYKRRHVSGKLVGEETCTPRLKD